ncbi:MAG: creatininase family protein [Phycisphaerae bacterium]|nr:creatininase family protein [Phycisphaerae bacterium]
MRPSLSRWGPLRSVAASTVLLSAAISPTPVPAAPDAPPIALGSKTGTPSTRHSLMTRYELIEPQDVIPAAKRCPVAYISAGIVEWHGEQSACGLDGLKAESLCRLAADHLGGVCFPHVWPGPDTSTPFDPTKYPRGTVTIDKALYLTMVEQLLSRVESMGFRVAVHLSGHYPGTVPTVAERFNKRGKMKVISVSENQVVQGMPAGDHAATWETSLLQVLRPGLVDLGQLPPLPPNVEHAGDVMPPAWKFRQRAEYYGVYGSDPRVWANPHFGRRGVEAILDGLAKEVGKALEDPSYGQSRPPIQWPTPDHENQPEVRYDFLRPSQWIHRFEQAPIVFLPLLTARTPAERLTGLAERWATQSGGMVFPPLSYAPAKNAETAFLSIEVYVKAVKQVIDVLAEMDFRVIALLPDPALSPDARAAIAQIARADGQADVLVLDPNEEDTPAPMLLAAVARMIPKSPSTRILDGDWRIDGPRTVKSLHEAVYGPADVRTYEHTFDVSPTQAGQAALLDLGTVENLCEVTINGAPALQDHWPPYRFILTGRLKPGPNALKVVVRHKPQPFLDPWYYRPAPPKLAGPITLSFWTPAP